MQSNNLKIAAAATTTLQIPGTGFWFESGTSTTTDTYIVVKPDNGTEFRLKPGQHVQDNTGAMVTVWRVTASDPTAVIDGKVIIGNGEFGDSNVSNTFKLDATFANQVQVMNTTAQRVPVTLDSTQSIGINNTTGQRIPVTLDLTQQVKLDPTTTINTSANTMAYTHSYASTAASVASTAINMLPAATNVNGALLSKFDVLVQAASSAPFVVIAKATAPASLTDGDVLYSNYITTGGVQKFSLDIGKDGQPKVPAGKGIWYFTTVNDNCNIRDALFTVF